jgi:hypothetical protein
VAVPVAVAVIRAVAVRDNVALVDRIVDGVAGALARTHDAPVYAGIASDQRQVTRCSRERSPTPDRHAP